ncbi:hypothetical protein RND81_10G092200 [Saponaria officinalis]|uniref:AB hydrolase-1 domain-containing protein n=1 Tax=Saponaria officinalis TaxID=3572 RepID=A0AAW1I031_SAPOF
MQGILTPCDHHHLILGSVHNKYDKHTNFSGLFNNLTFKLKNSFGYFWDFDKGKPMKRNFVSGVVVNAASSPSLDASDYSEQLIGGRTKKKRRSVAGIDQDELLEPRHLADADSCFCEFKGVQIHYKVCEPEPETPIDVHEKNKKIGFPMVLLHGFGASTFSWHRVMKPFAEITGSKVLAFDRPAFGLTSRVSHPVQAQGTNDTTPLNPYSMAFSVLATLYFIGFLTSEKAVLVGHSAGCLTAVETYLEAPDRVAALILVAPAIFAPLSAENATKEKQSEKENQVQESNSGSYQRRNPFPRLGQILSRFVGFITKIISQMLKGMVDMASTLYKKALAAILRSAIAVSLVRMIIDKFGIAAIKNAWHDATQVTDHILQGYTKPLRIKNWDKAFVEFTATMLLDSQTKLKPPLQKKLHEIKCPVLIVTGDNDRLVPSWNSVRLSRAIPGSQVEIISKCGHLPQEEKPDELISIVTKFLLSVFAEEELCFQT